MLDTNSLNRAFVVRHSAIVYNICESYTHATVEEYYEADFLK